MIISHAPDDNGSMKTLTPSKKSSSSTLFFNHSKTSTAASSLHQHQQQRHQHHHTHAPSRKCALTDGFDIDDIPGQSYARAQRRLTLARALESTVAPMTDVERHEFMDGLAERDRKFFEPAIAAYYFAHPEHIPEREEDAKTRRRKRYDEFVKVRDSQGNITDVASKQKEIFEDYDWSLTTTITTTTTTTTNTTTNTAAGSKMSLLLPPPPLIEKEVVGPKGEAFRGETVICVCARCQAEPEPESRQTVRRLVQVLLGGLCCGLSPRSSNKQKTDWQWETHGVIMSRGEEEGHLGHHPVPIGMEKSGANIIERAEEKEIPLGEQ